VLDISDQQKHYRVYDYGDNLKPGDQLKIEHSICFDEQHANLAAFQNVPIEALQGMRQASADKEQVIFERLRASVSEWETQAAQTLLLDSAIEYARVAPVRHSANQWAVNEYNTSMMISNMAYKMYYQIYEHTEYNREMKTSIPVAWYLTWSVHTNAPDHNGYNSYNTKLAGQDRKRFTDKSEMERYLEGRKAAYAHLFAEVSPPIPPGYAKAFHVNGLLLPGYTLQGETPPPPPPTRPKRRAARDVRVR